MSKISGVKSFTPSKIFKERVSNEGIKIYMDKIPLYPERPDFWRGTITCNGRWNGKYNINIQLPEEYPYVVPTVRWETTLFPKHPNIEPNSGRPYGDVCLSILSYDWRPQYTLITIYKSLIWLLENPSYHSWDRPSIVDTIPDNTSIDSILKNFVGGTKHFV